MAKKKKKSEKVLSVAYKMEELRQDPPSCVSKVKDTIKGDTVSMAETLSRGKRMGEC